MAIELIGAAGMTNELKQTYDRLLLPVAETDFVYVKYGEKKPIPARGGKSVEFRRFEKVTITGGSYTLTEGTPPSVTNATVSNVAATISQYGQYSQISDILELQGFDPVIAEFATLYREAMAEGLDVVVRNGLSSATTLQYAGAATVVATSGAGAVGSGNYLTVAEIREFKRTLRRNGARQPYVLYLHPDNTKDLREDPEFADAIVNAGARGNDNPFFAGNIPPVEGVQVVETNNLRIRSSYGMSGADVYENVMFGKGFYGVTELDSMQARLIIHPRGTGGHTDPLDQFSTIGWKAALAAVILNNNFGGIIYTASSRTNAA